jgi:5'-3' exonuclease
MNAFVMEGKPVYDLLHKDESEVILDSHMVTPGTEFMYKFSKALRSYVISRTNSDPGWRDIKVWSYIYIYIYLPAF